MTPSIIVFLDLLLLGLLELGLPFFRMFLNDSFLNGSSRMVVRMRTRIDLLVATRDHCFGVPGSPGATIGSVASSVKPHWAAILSCISTPRSREMSCVLFPFFVGCLLK